MKSLHMSHRLRNQLILGLAVAGYFGLLAVEIAATERALLGPLGIFTLAMVVGALTGAGLVACPASFVSVARRAAATETQRR